MTGGFVPLIIWLLVIGVLIALVHYVADAIPFPAPFNRIVKIAVVVIGCIVVLLLLLQMIGVGTGVDMPSVD